jgi:Fic family protein
MARLYVWEQPDWPNFSYDGARLLSALGAARRAQGQLSGEMAHIGFNEREEALLETLTVDAVETSKIEGEDLDYAAVRSSVALRLGMPQAAIAPTDARSEGIASIVLDAVEHFSEPLTRERIFRWHRELFPGNQEIVVGNWRPGPVGVYRYARVDQPPVTEYVAPPAERVALEMQRFLDWFNSRTETDGIVRSALAHLWFVTIHPFEDGNGRIARAIADMAMAQDDHATRRFFSMSRQIREERKRYYAALKAAQRGNLDVTSWLEWFLQCYERAVQSAMHTLSRVLRANTFWAHHHSVSFTARQRKGLTHVLHGFEGAITTKNWQRLAQTSRESAQRDLSDLVEKRVLRSVGAGRSTRYELLED